MRCRVLWPFLSFYWFQSRGMDLKKFIKRVFQSSRQAVPEEAEPLRVAFKTRYHHFKLLLNANNRALEIMADLEKTLYGIEPFGMGFIRSSCTSLSVSVFRMIKNLDELAPGKYTALYSRFDSIQKKIETLLKIPELPVDNRLVLDLDEVNADMADIAGNKMAHLGQMKNKIYMPVPEGFVITANAYYRFMEANDIQTEIDRRLQSAEKEDIQELYSVSADIQQMIIRAEIPPDLSEAIDSAFLKLEEKGIQTIHLAVRSSALGEDAVGSAFAGQYRTELNISRENLFEAFKEVISSKYTLQAMTYRLNKGIKDEDTGMAVGCLTMVDARVGGVAYSRNPVDKRDDSIFINAAWGLPKSVVDGSVDCDSFKVSREPELHLTGQEIKDKKIQFSCYPEEGICREEVIDDAHRHAPSLTPDQVLAIADQVLALEKYYGSPQDMEWAITKAGKIMVLQCRPLFQAGETREPFDPIQPDLSEILISGGITASPGAASGTAYRVDKGADMFQFPKGAVLIVRQALPRWASLLSRASGVISEQGGFAGHLANVAREFGIPALFGIKDVFNLVQNEEIITLDADAGVVYKGKIDRILSPRKQTSMMIGTPVHETLMQVSRHIVPLNLLDPDGIDFKAEACETLHDITRFVHEKSVSEMFNFGKEHNFSERSSKQLHYKVPMQWWILNLDDGFAEEITGKYIKLENIVCIPMLAFWEGYTAIPWEGPPAIDGKGLVSVMFQATTNPALTTGTRSRYAERNYFMISKNYMSLNSRLGFHFSILEALVSERPMENYINFQFKGGAADMDRRFRRVSFIGDLLEQFEFRVDRKGDTLLSRIENREKQFMIDRLKMLGYLTLHTRQLDMIMASPDRVLYYKTKMQKDLEKLSHS